MGRTRILVVGEQASRAAAGLSGEVALERSPSAADALMRIAAGDAPDLALASWDGDGQELVRNCRESAPGTPVLVLAAEGSVGDAMEAVRAGAFDYLTAGAGAEGLALAVRRALRQSRASGGRRVRAGEDQTPPVLPGIVGGCPAMLDLVKTAARVAATDATVLLLGERGTGRELLARAIHAASPRASGPFVAIDCGAMPEETLEEKVFGGDPEAATPDGRESLLHSARGGTVYLGSVARLGRHAQGLFLRALEEGLPRHGASGASPVDFRFIASSDEDLRALAKRGRFREDLLYRLDVVALNVPPLRERREDVPRLARYFAARHAPGGTAEVTPEALQVLLAYPWPGNVRELESAIARALALASAPVVLPENLPPTVTSNPWVATGETPLPGSVPFLTPLPFTATPYPRQTPPPRTTPAPAAATSAREGALPTLAEMERRYAWEVLRAVGGNKTRAAEALGIDRKTLYRLLGEDGGGNGR